MVLKNNLMAFSRRSRGMKNIGFWAMVALCLAMFGEAVPQNFGNIKLTTPMYTAEGVDDIVSNVVAGIVADKITDGTNTIDAARNVYETRVDVHAPWRYYGNGVLWGVLSWSGHDWRGDEPYPMLRFNDGTWTFIADQSVTFYGSGSISDTVVTNLFSADSTVSLRLERETSVSAYLGKLALTNDIPQSVAVVAPSTNAIAGQAADAKATGTALYTG